MLFSKGQYAFSPTAPRSSGRISKQRMCGKKSYWSTPLGSIPRLHVSSFGVIPKKNQVNKWRLILDLSHPSVNDGISESLSTVSYITIDRVMDKICQLSQGSLLAKMNVQHAFWLVPVHPEDRWLLGMKWKEQHCIDTVLPFGLRSAPKIFTALADALQWTICKQAATWVAHYLDFFFWESKLHCHCVYLYC